MLRMASTAVLGLAALAVLGIASLMSAAILWPASSSSLATGRPQQPAAVLRGFLQTCPLPGYCLQRTAGSSNSSSGPLRPAEPVMAAYRIALEQHLKTQDFEARKARLAGLPDARGIVYVGGGRGMLGAITASLWTLRHKLNCSLPAEIAYIGSKKELNPAAIAALNTTLGPVYGLDLSAVPYPAHHNPAGKVVLDNPGHKIQNKPWEAKAWALYNSRFRQVLMADYDTYPLLNPEELFDGPHMTLHGNLHWGDIAYGRWGSQAVHDAMKALGISNTTLPLLAGTQPIPGMAESGHVLLDRVRHADVLEYLWWITTHSDVIYNILWGDKDTYMLAFAAAGKASAYAQMPIPPAAALSGTSGEFHGLMAMLQHDHYGRPAWVHNTLNKHGEWGRGPPAPYSLLTGPMPEWVGTRLSNHPNIFTMNATRLMLLQVAPPGTAVDKSACPQAVWAQFLRLQALGITLLPQPQLLGACKEELQQVLHHSSSSNSSSERRGRQSRALLQDPSDACLQTPAPVGHLDQLQQQQAAQQQLAPVQWASVLAGCAAMGELAHALTSANNTPAGASDQEREGLSRWVAAADAPPMLVYLNWHLMAAKTAPAACASGAPGRRANADGAMPVLQLQHPGNGGAAGAADMWSALDLAQVVWLPEVVKWIQGNEVIKQHV